MGIYRWTPLFIRILAGAVVGAGIGLALGERASGFKPVSDIILQTLRLLATPLIFLSVLRSILTANVERRAGRLAWLLLSNTAIATGIGLLLVNVIRPGEHVRLPAPTAAPPKSFDLLQDLIDKLPKDLINPFAGNDLIGIILLALTIGLALRKIRNQDTQGRIAAIASYVDLGLKTTMQLLHWLFELLPLAVLAVVAAAVGTAGVASVFGMIWFVASVLAGLFIMFGVYLLRLRVSSRIPPGRYVKGGSDAFLLAFSTASSAATLPVTFDCAVSKIGLSEDTASLGIMVGGTFNHDGSALFQAMAAVFVSQAIGNPLGLAGQATVGLLAMLASVSVAGIPEAGLVLMIAVFNAVHLPVEYVPLLLPLDWILDRFRTTINVAGDLAATCMLDGKPPLTKPSP